MVIRSWLAVFATSVLSLTLAPPVTAQGDLGDLVPKQLNKEQRTHVMQFLKEHEKADRFVPANATVVGSLPAKDEALKEPPAGQQVKQYMVQIQLHRPVPGQETPSRVDVYYYRPNPEKGKPGITVKHTVDSSTGQQVGATEVLLNSHTPLSREELAEAVEMAKKQSPAVQNLFKDPNQGRVRGEYLQLMISRKHGMNDPGDRVVRIVFTTNAIDQQPAPAPVRVLVNLTKGSVASEPD